MSDTLASERNAPANGTLSDTIESIEDAQLLLDSKSNSKSKVFSDYIVQEEPLKIVEPSDKLEKSVQEKEKEKVKKCVTFNPNDEKIRKFTTGDPIVDQQNPFKNGLIDSSGKKKTPPPVPTKRSTLSVRKTVTQQLREREREKEKEREKLKERELEEKSLKDKEREQLKNEANNRKKAELVGDDFITTEEVLKQSKYVKTYIKNPDAYFVYDPTVLARLKFEELREISGKPPKRKQVWTNGQQAAHRLREAKTPATKLAKQQEANGKPKTATFKKCSKPNYPELANLKIRTGTDTNGVYFNPAEVTKNAKKFDERVKKLQISSDDDLDEIDGPLTKSESSDELNPPSAEDDPATMTTNGNGNENGNGHPLGTFTNTISSEEFHAYLERKGLALMPKREINSPTPTTTPKSTPAATPTVTPTRATAEERRQQVAESLAALRKSNTKKLSVLQRLSNSLFATRRKTTPKAVLPAPRSVYSDAAEPKQLRTPAEMRRILLENQPNGQLRQELRQPQPQPQPRSKPTLEARLEPVPFQRSTVERQSLIPRRVSPPENNLNRFTRSASMDRNQIKLHGQRTLSRLESVGQRRSVASNEERSSNSHSHSNSNGNASSNSCSYPIATSTPVRKALETQSSNQNEWEQLRAIKEVTDRQLYNKVMQQQQQQLQQQQQQQLQRQRQRQSEENIYEHLQSQQLAAPAAFVRGSVQRNTYAGVSGRNRQMLQQQQQQQQQQQKQQQQQQQQQQLPARCQSVLDELISPPERGMRRGYESENENETPVVLRRKEANAGRRIGGLLTRDEILEKVKDFCRKSINRTPAPAAKMQPIYERHNGQQQHPADISPVSYASVETQKRPASQLSLARPQVPLRVQSLPRSSYAATASPIYAHVNKRNSLLSNESEQYVSNQQLLQRQSLVTLTPTEYVLIQTEDGLQAAKLITDYQHNSSLYMQPQYIRASPQGYVRIEELAMAQQQQQQLQQQQLQQQQQQQHGRATPLILDRAAQQTSQIYWTPQHQRLQQTQQANQANQLTLQKTPRMYPVPAPRLHMPQGYVLANGQAYATVMPAPRNQANRQQSARNASNWDCSSEAGEIRHILDKSL
ncbi:PREDICTED: putative mediator of RNA polymerase II transcription subunit 26 isoform X2 [Drosophila arizonae]|uniref:Mediator of RNA polymerase II transcription subunit 26 isoform X2 n=1 Tax=Drosophila arizonae TaxID=7263 RepID=A0ABM1PXZ1_DROAR|nr:PREDICTED: putative mediator of RNA polymerase II transcription subunit 26 isoform X2 [Drosophila arizonae]